jgi:hypothetical protein
MAEERRNCMLRKIQAQVLSTPMSIFYKQEGALAFLVYLVNADFQRINKDPAMLCICNFGSFIRRVADFARIAALLECAKTSESKVILEGEYDTKRDEFSIYSVSALGYAVSAFDYEIELNR